MTAAEAPLIRRWALANGYSVCLKGGQIPQEIIAAYRLRNTPTAVPEQHHRAAANRILHASRDDGAEGVIAALDNLTTADLPMVIVALAHAAWDRKPLPIDGYTEAETKEAHARYYRGLRDPWTIAGERSYNRTRRRQQRGTAA